MKTPETPSPSRMMWKILQSLLIVGGLFYVYRIRVTHTELVPAKPDQLQPQALEPSAPETDPPATPVFQAALFSTRIREAGGRSGARIAEAERHFQHRVRELQGHQGFLQWLESTAAACGRQMDGDRDLLNLIRYSAEDSLRDSNRVETWVAARLNAQMDPWVQAFTNELHLATVELDRALTASREELAYDLAMAAHETHAPMAVLDPDSLKMDLLSFSMRPIVLQGGLLVALSPLEIHGLITSQFLRRIPAMVSQLVARIFQKQVAAATVAVASPVADGPLPIGDIVGGVVAIGGTAWTIADWNRLKRDLQRNVESGVRDELRSLRNQGLGVIREQGSARIAQTRQIQQGLLARAHEEETRQVVNR